MAIDKVTTASITDDAVTNAKVSYNNNQFRNIVINGDMSIAQRGTSTASISSGSTFTLDRFVYGLGTAGTWTMSQDTDVPTGQGFAKSLKLDCTTANGSLSSGSYAILQTRIEGQNLQYLKFGTSSAESLTLSFWVKSSKTGTHIANLYDHDNNKHLGGSYTVSSADTWEKKTITYVGNTSNNFGNDNGKSLEIRWWMVAGSSYSSGTLPTTWSTASDANMAPGQVNLADSTSNNFYITGVQLEAGTSASDFEFLPYDINRDRCYRYYYKVISSGLKFVGWAQVDNDDVAIVAYIDFKTDMRVAPSAIETTGSASNYQVREALTYTCSAVPTFNSADLWYSTLSFKKSGITSSNGFAQGELLKAGINSGYLAWSAEL